MKVEKSVPKRRRIKSRRRVITQKKAYNDTWLYEKVHELVWIKLKVLFYFYLDDMFRSTDHHEAVLTKL